MEEAVHRLYQRVAAAYAVDASSFAGRVVRVVVRPYPAAAVDRVDSDSSSSAYVDRGTYPVASAAAAVVVGPSCLAEIAFVYDCSSYQAVVVPVVAVVGLTFAVAVVVVGGCFCSCFGEILLLEQVVAVVVVVVAESVVVPVVVRRHRTCPAAPFLAASYRVVRTVVADVLAVAVLACIRLRRPG